jgi:HAD superfamily hydrolase (TIGR01458 family)
MSSVDEDPLDTKGVLLDIDGVLYVGNRVIDGAVRAVESLKAAGLALRCLSNTTTKPASAVMAKLSSMGFPVTPQEIITAPAAAVRYLKERRARRCHFVLRSEVRKEFSGFETDESNPEFIILGDIGDRWDYSQLNRVFGMMMAGAELIALHKGRFWQVEEGLKVDIGAFVAGLEYAAGKEAVVIGKPSAEFYRLALQDLGLEAADVLMVGDDIDSDVGGAQKAGLKGVLVRTGKYREDVVQRSQVKADYVLASIADLPNLLSLDKRL